MTEEIYWLGSAPAEESCVQVGDPDYARDAKNECRQYMAAIRIVCGEPPEGAKLVVRSQPHDFGSYFEVAVVFDGTNREAVAYAAKVDEQAPTTWAAAGLEPPERGVRGLG